MKYGKEKPARGSEGFISHALTGGQGPSNEIVDAKVDRPHQSIKTAFAMDNVKLAMDVDTSLKGGKSFGGGVDNLKHSLSGASAVNEEVGASSSLKHTIIPDH